MCFAAPVVHLLNRNSQLSSFLLYLKQTRRMKRIVVFCGAGDGYNEVYREVAYEVGGLLASQGIHIVYGGGKVGIMGAVADGALQSGGKVTGIIPSFLKTKEVAHTGVTEMITVETMHERKLRMNELSDAILTLPGGWGTMEELFEMLTWSQLGLHSKPIGLLNVNGYYDPLKALCSTMVQEGFLDERVNASMIVSRSIDELLVRMNDYTPPPVSKWLTENTV